MEKKYARMKSAADSARHSTRSGFAPVGDASLYYDITGAGDPIVLVHGFALDSRLWDDQVRAWSSHRQVIRYDLRGFGKSTSGSEPYAHADDLKELLRQLGVDCATLVGLSLGGGAIINFALAWPEAVRALVLVDSTLGGFRYSKQFVDEQAHVRATSTERGVPDARGEWLTSPLFAQALTIPAAGSALRSMVGDYSGCHWTGPDLGRGMKPFAATRLAEITAPTLVIVGEHDTPDFQEIADLLARDIPHATKVVVPGSGHLPNLEAPDVFNEMVADFVNRLGDS